MKLLYSSYSKAGADCEGRIKANQDTAIAIENLAGQKSLLLGVFDGHGPEGDVVSAVVADLVPRSISHNTLMQESRYAELMCTVFPEIDSLLTRSCVMDTQLSGCTACVALFPGGNRLVVANLGDSRCLLGTLNHSGVMARALSTDHTPDHPDEAQRIIAAGGRVAPYQHQGQSVGPPRVWLKQNQWPGLRVTRTLGDTMAHTIGVTAVPEVLQHLLQPEDRYLVLVSDGVLAFMANQEVMDIVHVAATVHDMCPRQASRHLVKEARKRWAANEDGLMDDCSCVIVYLKHEVAAADGYVSIKTRSANARRWLPKSLSKGSRD